MKQYFLILILAISFCLNFWNHDFSSNYHMDEPKKVAFVASQTQDFMHPTLLLQSVRGLHFFLSDRVDIMTLGRFISAISLTTIVGLCYLLARRQLNKKWSMIVALVVATCPILTVHAHYFKEDLLFTCFTTLSILALLTTFDHPTKKNFIFLGLAMGLAMSTKYLGFILIPFFLLLSIKHGAKRIWGSIALSLLVFLSVNYQLFLDPQNFINGFSYEIDHAVSGHKMIAPLPIDPVDFYYTFHITHSLIPGMTWLIATLGIIYTVYALIKGSVQEQVISAIAISLYLIIEHSPLKAFPDYMRYMIPIVPLLILSACTFASKNRLAAGLLYTGLLLASWDSLNLISNLKEDTRALAKSWIQDNGAIAIGENYTDCSYCIPTLSVLKNADHATHLVASSFVYDRIYFAKNLKNHAPEIDTMHQFYEDLFSKPYIEIAPRYKSYAFSNPTIRIIDIR